MIYFIRHGETDWNVQGRLQGQRDIPLNAQGQTQGIAVSQKLKEAAGSVHVLDYVASPLERTRHTMETVRCELGLPPDGYRVDERLKEIHFGEWEGLTWAEIREKDPERLSLRDKDRWNFDPPRGGENYHMLCDRVMSFVNEIKRDTVMVSHGGVARALLVALCGASPQKAPIEDIFQGQLLVFRNGNSLWI